MIFVWLFKFLYMWWLAHPKQLSSQYDIMNIITTLTYTVVRNITNRLELNQRPLGFRTIALTTAPQIPYLRHHYVCLYTKLSRLYYCVNYQLLICCYTLLSLQRTIHYQLCGGLICYYPYRVIDNRTIVHIHLKKVTY